MDPGDRPFFRHLLVAGVVALALVGFILFMRPGPTGPVSRYVIRPAPASVRNVRVAANDWVLGLAPEPVVYLSFQISASDLDKLVAVRRYSLSAGRYSDGFPGGQGPAWWNPPLREEGTRVWTRSGRRGSEYLVADRTGTNVWFLLWGV